MKNYPLPRQSVAGFTLLEMLVVLMIVGILSAIATPRWITFINQRRVNAANEAVLIAIQQAQQEAKRRKIDYSVSFKTDATTKFPQIAFHLGSAPASLLSTDSWKPLGAGLEIKPGQLWMGTNLKGKNTKSADSSVSVPPSTPSTTTPTITFNYMGTLTQGAATGLKVVVALPPSGSSTSPPNSTKRCIIVQTILGSIQTARGNDAPGTACN